MSNTRPLEAQLEAHFGYTTFKTGQKDIIADVLAGKDVFGILPTGTGKSLCYQLPAKLLPGLTIVVTPLVSLMMDQVKELQAIRYKGVAAINGFVNKAERMAIYHNLTQYRLIYLSPELLQQEEAHYYFRNANVSLFVIDEAHCISQWGHEFRPDYLKLGSVIQELGNPQILALSATAAPKVIDDITEILQRPQMVRHVFPMDRENIALVVEQVADDAAKLSMIMEWLQKGYGPTLIYFSSRSISEEIAAKLIARMPDKRIAYYHGGMESTDRVMIQQQFMNGQLDIVCCTSAFGMGINKADIRLVIHYHFPTDLESFIQEIGRAGRDGNSSISLLLYHENDLYLSTHLVQNDLPEINSVDRILQMLYQLEQQGQTEIGQDPAYQNLFQLSETQWRFLYYQFEKHGIIVDNRIHYDQTRFCIENERIKAHIQDRLAYKETKLKQMLHWIQEPACLRISLYQHFQTGCTIPAVNCCNHCGLDESVWHSSISEVAQTNSNALHWKEKLGRLLFS